MRIRDLFVEGLKTPLGIDAPRPALSWRFARSAERGLRQKAYRILVATREEALRPGACDVWESGAVESRRNVHVLYEGPELKSRTRYYWRVQVWDERGRMAESAPSWWETGLLHPGDWQALWIGGPEGAEGSEVAAPMLRREFALDKPVLRARAYVCGLGHYELRINGRKVGDRLLDPGWTNYDKTCLYAAFDVSEYLVEGANAAGVLLGNGFFHVTGGRYRKLKRSFGRPKCLLQIEVEHPDGTRTVVASGPGWKASLSPITFNCIYGGEDYDARLEQEGWDAPGFAEDERWTEAPVVDAPKGRLRAQTIPPLKVMRTFKPQRVAPARPGVFVVDLGQNFSGVFRLAVQGPRGASVTVRPAELLKDDGSADQRHTGSPHSYTYTLKGEGVEVWAPRFSYYGFRYLEVEGATPVELAPAGCDGPVLLDLEGWMIYPELETAGSLELSDPLLARVHALINWAILSNTKSLFTDCPHREKLGWLEQVHLMGPSITYNYQVEALLAKVVDDMRDAQLESGMIPTTAPEYAVFKPPWEHFRECVSWSAAYILAPWHMFERYGNRRVLEEHYESMKRFLKYVEASSKGLIVERGLGDWYDAGPKPPGLGQLTPAGLPETAIFFHAAGVFARIAALLGRHEDAQEFGRLADRIKEAFNERYFDPERGAYATGSQAANAIPLALGLVDEAHRERVFQNLVASVEAAGGHPTAGDVGLRFLLLALHEHGRPDLVEAMARKTEHPSYGFQVLHGATSLTEAWNGPVIGKSQNHFMLGHLEEWLYAGLAGLRYAFDPKAESYRLTFAPYIARGWHRTCAAHTLPAGEARCAWEKRPEGGLVLEVEVPVNCDATLHLPTREVEGVKESGRPLDEVPEVRFAGIVEGRAVLALPSGIYRFEIPARREGDSR